MVEPAEGREAGPIGSEITAHFRFRIRWPCSCLVKPFAGTEVAREVAHRPPRWKGSRAWRA